MRILVLFAHPRPSSSIDQTATLSAIRGTRTVLSSWRPIPFRERHSGGTTVGEDASIVDCPGMGRAEIEKVLAADIRAAGAVADHAWEART